MSGTPSRRSRLIAASATAVLALGALSGCVSIGGFGNGGGGGLIADDSWTVMTYIIADTNLEPYQADDVDEQTLVGSRPGFNLITYVDRSDDYYDGPMAGQPDWVGGKTLRITKGGSEVVADHGDVNTGDPAVLSEFIETTIRDNPAGHYALIINDHGSSWPGVGADGSFDDDSLSLTELHDGIADGLAGAGVDNLDLLGFDACLMATYETASTLQDVAQRMLSSEELEPGYGWDYSALETAARGGTVDELGSAIIDAYADQSSSEGQQQVTLSLTDLTKMPAVDEAMDAFAQSLTDGGSDLTSTIGRSLSDSLAYGSTPEYDFYMTDLGMLADGIGSAEAATLSAAIADATIDKMDGAATTGASGMAVYFPPNARSYEASYGEVEAAASWISFLESYYATAGQGSGAPQFASDTAESQFANGGFVIGQQIVSDPSQITDAYISYGYVEADNSVTLVGDEAARIDGDGFVTGFFDTYQLWIEDGASETSFYSSYSVNQSSGVATIGVPIAYFSDPSGDGEQAYLQMTYEPDTGTILSKTFYAFDSGAGAYSELAPAPGSVFKPLKISVTGSGSQYFISSDVGLSADPDGLSFGYRALDPGTFLYAELTIVNGAGDTATASAAGTL